MTVTLAREHAVARGHRDFRLLWFGQTSSALGSNVTSIALPLTALGTLHAGVLAISLLSAVTWVPWLVLGLPAGAWVDRLPPRPVLLTCDAVSLLLLSGVPIAAWCHVLTLGQLFAVAAGGGIAKVFFTTAYRAMLPSIVDADRLLVANARLQSSESGAQVIGPSVGGWLTQVVGAADALLTDAASFAVSFLCLLRLRSHPRRPAAGRGTSLWADIAVGLRFVRGDRLLSTMAIFGACANFALTGYGAIVLVFLVREVGASAATAGLLLAVGSVGGSLGSLAVPRLARRIGTARALLVAKVGALPLTLLIPLTQPGWRLGLFVIGTVVLVTGIVAGNVVSAGFTQSYCPPALRGRVSACLQVVNFGAMPLGALTGGLLAGTLGLRGALWVTLALLVLSGGLLLRSPLRTMRDLPTEPAGATSPGDALA